MSRDELEMYINGKRRYPPDDHIVILEADQDGRRVFIGRQGCQPIPVRLVAAARLDVRRDGHLVASFVERGGVAVDPVKSLVTGRGPREETG